MSPNWTKSEAPDCEYKNYEQLYSATARMECCRERPEVVEEQQEEEREEGQKNQSNSIKDGWKSIDMKYMYMTIILMDWDRRTSLHLNQRFIDSNRRLKGNRMDGNTVPNTDCFEGFVIVAIQKRIQSSL